MLLAVALDRAVCRNFAKGWRTWGIFKKRGGGGQSCKQRQGEHWKTC